MGKRTFKFTEDQCKRLLECWGRKKEKALAVDFLDAVELSISMWRDVALPNPQASRKDEQQQLDNLALKAKEMIRAFEGLSHYVACALPFVLHFEKHGEVSSNFRADYRLISPLPGQSPQGQDAYRLIAEAFPDPVTQVDFCMGILRRIKSAAEDFGLERQPEQTKISKYNEVSLLDWLICDYVEHFGKYPTAGNARSGEPEGTSPFRKFAVEIGKIVSSASGMPTITLGAPIIRRAIAEAKKDDLLASKTRHNLQNKSRKN